jgi:murein DD-endopeptidase MepM/ murein hydrolase activator NlpD
MKRSGLLTLLGSFAVAASWPAHAALPSRAALDAQRAPTTLGAPLPQSQAALALAALDRRIADLDAEEESTKHELSGLGGKLSEAHARTILRGRAFYRLTRAGMLPVGGGFDALVTHAMHVERARRALISDIGEEKRLHERGADLARGLERVARDRVALAGQRTAMDSARIAMADEERRRKAFDRAFEASSAGASDYVPIYGGASAEPATPGGFQTAKGRLLFPVLGRAEVRAAHREGTDGPGLEVHAPQGAVVRAVYSGRVAFADRYGPYGRIVIVDHGEHYFTVNGNLASVDVKVGDDLGAGDRVGTVGDDGQGAMLYFEIRHGAETIPPGAWLGL